MNGGAMEKNETREVEISIPVSELECWLDALKNGFNSKVNYSEDPLALAQEAIKEKNKSIYYVSQRINCFVSTYK